MTLVLSDCSRHGFIMLGDSAVVKKTGSRETNSLDKACKVHYLREANIGLAIWGIRSLGDEKADRLLGQFVDSHEEDDLGLEECGHVLADLINTKLDRAGHSGKDRIGGIHLCGYFNEQPKLWHVHWCATEKQGRWGLAKDLPESDKLSEAEFDRMLRDGTSAQLANGFYRTLNLAREGLMTYSKLLKRESNLQFPEDSIEGQMIYVRTMFLMVSAAMNRTDQPHYVDENLRMIVFDRLGLIKPIMNITILEESDPKKDSGCSHN